VARALAIAHTCMYDAWAQFDDVAVGTVCRLQPRPPVGSDPDATKSKAISFAAYRCLRNLYPDDGSSKIPSPSARLGAVLTSHGYSLGETCDSDDACRDSDSMTPAGVGNHAAQAVIDARRHDGSNQYGDLNPGAYSDYTGYAPRNPPMGFCTPLFADCPPLQVDDPNHWQPLIGPTGVTQTFVGAQWERVTPFALTSAGQFDHMAFAPAPDIFKNPGHYHKNVNEVLQFSKGLDAARKLIVEYWADGPDSELPPGHWGLFAQFVSKRDNHSIDQDVEMFFTMHNASFDAGIVAWHFKRNYDGVRPITAVRHLKQGQIVRAFGGPGRPTENIPGEKWMPYNPGSNLTPAFPGYFSGHSTFSSASAEVLRSFTGSDSFGFSTVIPADFGRVEPGIPAVTTTVSFATFSDAAKEAGLSRLYGGIHFSDDNTRGQAVGTLIGRQAWEKAQTYFNGTAP